MFSLLIARFLLLVAAVGFVQASLHNSHNARSNHARIGRRNPHPLVPDHQLRDIESPHRRADRPTGRCKAKKASTTSSSAHPTESTLAPVANNAKVEAPAPAKPSSQSKPAPSPEPKKDSSPAPGPGLMRVVSQQCGQSRATAETSKTCGPNGDIEWLNCGVTGGGWNPPNVGVNDLVVKDLRSVLGQPNNIFKNCAPYVDLFEEFSSQYNVPTILVASIAMQESSCNPNTVGGAGEQGLMQITRDKCQGRDDAGCREPRFNIQQGVSYFSKTLAECGGNVLETIGRYNGWSPKMTYGSATAAAHTSCCRCQNNLDYVHQTLNAWAQGIDPYANHIGKYFNLDVCDPNNGHY